MSLRKKTLTAAFWAAMLRFTTRSIDFFKLPLLTRLLSPADFGIFALATATINILETMSETGFSYAFIHMQEDIKDFAKTIWIVNIGRGAILTLISIATAHLVGIFFKSQNLSELLIYISLIPLIDGFENPSVFLFQKNLDFHKEFLYRFVPTLINASFAIYFSFTLHSVKGLIFALLIGNLCQTLFSFIVVKPDFSRPFSKSHAKNLFSYGKYLTLGGIFSYLTTQIDNIFIGRVFGAAVLGLYDIAFKLANVAFSEITDTISKVLFPLFSTLQTQHTKLKQTLTRNIILVSIPALFATLLFLFFPQRILFLIFGSKWIGAARILQILSLYGFLRASLGPLGPFFLAIGKPGLLSKVSIINFALIAVLIYPFARLWQMEGVAICIVVSYALTIPILLYETKKYFAKTG
ncbi:MAG TPA: lipopolysaccharide biosynthesis protein [Candidatus Saccharimonadales bacterium]|nr:lipopolysaccharide biosynthesis protein [Candidatus Saccharimonadales bacterium]